MEDWFSIFNIYFKSIDMVCYRKKVLKTRKIMASFNFDVFAGLKNYYYYYLHGIWVCYSFI